MPNIAIRTPTRYRPATTAAQVGQPAGSLAPSRRLLAYASAGSIVSSLLAGWFLADSGHDPLSDPDTALVRAVLSTPAATVLLLALGVIGALAALSALAWPGFWAVRTLLAAVGVVQVAGLGVAFQSVTTIALAGYLVAMALPFGLGWLAVQTIRRYRRARWIVLAAMAVAGVWGAVTGVLRPAHLAGLAADLCGGFAGHAAQLIMVVLLSAAAAAWVLVSNRSLRDTRPDRVVGAWVLRHRRAVTLVAAAGPVPYGLIRATWLTPWPLLVPPGEGIDPEMRLWGLLLGGGAALGVVLTLGLIRPWGRIFPRWMPWRGGDRVPVGAAVIPGGLVAGVLCASAAPMLYGIWAPANGTVFGGASQVEQLAACVIFPFWAWGPALALAVWGYAAARRDSDRTQA